MNVLEHRTRFRIRAQDPSGELAQARRAGRALAARLGFAPSRAVLVAAVISELARNMQMYAGEGEIRLAHCRTGLRRGLCICAIDEGPGIADVEKALMCGYSTSGSLGQGLPGVHRIVDEFSIETAPGCGTRVEVVLWV